METIALKTKLPGPGSTALMAERQKHVAKGPFHSTPIFVSKAKGAILEDVDGNHFLDFASGIAVTNVGHSHDTVIGAVHEQATRFLHTSFNVVAYELYVKVAETLNRITPGHFPKKTFLANCGAEAVENAVKIARYFTGRQAVVCFDHAFHGRTYLAMTLTAKSKPYKYGFAPFCSEIYRAPFPYFPNGADKEALSQDCFKKLEELVTLQIGVDKVAAVIIEPVAGEGGFLPADFSFLKKLREFCSTHGIVLIFDEIQTGFGRTGKLFAAEYSGVSADIMTMAKGLAAGLPLSAVTGRAEIMDSVPEGGIGGTYNGNPVACAAALASMAVIERENLGAHAYELGQTLSQQLSIWKEKYSCISDVRGLGLMQAFELVEMGEATGRATSLAAKDFTVSGSAGRSPELAKKIVKYCYEHGLILLTAGTYGNVVRILPPLNLRPDQLRAGLAIIESAIKDASNETV